MSSPMQCRGIPDAVVQMLELYRKDRQSPEETFKDCADRLGVDYWKQSLEAFTSLPSFDDSPEAYRDWGAEQDFSLEGMGPGECAS